MLGKFANPRLIDVFGSTFTQEDVDFAIPRLLEDIPLCIDPFLFWASGTPDYRQLHERILDFFREIARRVEREDFSGAADLLAGCVEQPALGLGYASGSKHGSNIGSKLAADVLRVHQTIPQLRRGEMRHLEELQLVVPGIAEDRVSDTAAAILLDFFISFSATSAARYGIPTRRARVGQFYDSSRKAWIPAGEAKLPFNPLDESPILLAPLDLLRRLPWINYPDYYGSHFVPLVLPPGSRKRRVAKQAVLDFNARNYVQVERYVHEKEATADRCAPDPLFVPLARTSLKTRFAELRGLPTGRGERADQRFEDLAADLLTSCFSRRWSSRRIV